MKKILYSLLILSVVFASACHKDKKVTPGGDGPPTTGTPLDKIRDSIYLYAKEDNLWNDQLPNYSTFNPRASKYTGADDLTTLTNEVNALSQYAINPLTS